MLNWRYLTKYICGKLFILINEKILVHKDIALLETERNSRSYFIDHGIIYVFFLKRVFYFILFYFCWNKNKLYRKVGEDKIKLLQPMVLLKYLVWWKDSVLKLKQLLPGKRYQIMQKVVKMQSDFFDKRQNPRWIIWIFLNPHNVNGNRKAGSHDEGC